MCSILLPIGWTKKCSFKMQVSEIPDEQVCMWCLQDLGYLLLPWALVLCSCLSQNGFLGLIRCIPTQAGWGKLLKYVHLGRDFHFLLVSSVQGSESLVMAGKRRPLFLHSATEDGWTGDPRALQVWTHHDVCRAVFALFVFRISHLIKWRSPFSRGDFCQLTNWTNLGTNPRR